MSSPTHYKVKAKAIKRILDSPTIVIMSVEGVHILSLPLRALAASVLVTEQERRERSGASTSPDILHTLCKYTASYDGFTSTNH